MGVLELENPLNWSHLTIEVWFWYGAMFHLCLFPEKTK